jgi:D-tyrosyl-tRNA(Tyr) deacylase
VAGEVVGEIGPGLAVLVGVADGDTAADAEALAAKLTALRIFADGDGKMNLSVGEAGGAVLVISQFTLLADVRKGRRPSFTGAAVPGEAERIVAQVVEAIEATGIQVAQGRFGAHMEVDLVNDGPVTIVAETADGRVL